jgi:predicted PurR-regulated permease PerM
MSQNPTPPTTTRTSEIGVYQPDWAAWVRQFVSIGLVIAGVWALTLLSPVVNVLITTFLLSFLMFVPARIIAARSQAITYNVSVLIMFAILLVAIFVLLVLIIPALVNVIQSVINAAVVYVNRIQDAIIAWEPGSGGFMIELPLGIVFDATEFAQPLRDFLVADTTATATTAVTGSQIIESIPPLNFGQIANTIAQIAVGLVSTLGGFVSTLIVSLLLSLVILLELPRYQTSLLESFPRHQRELRLLLARIMDVWQGFFRGQLLLCVVIGILTFIQLTIMGIPSAFIVSVIVAVISLIPTIGGIVALVPLFVIPLIQGSTTLPLDRFPLAVAVVVVNLVISQIIWNVVAPKIMGDAVNLPLPLIILGIIVGAAVGGALGAFLIVPILGMIRVVIEYLMAKITRRDPYPGEVLPNVTSLAEI